MMSLDVLPFAPQSDQGNRAEMYAKLLSYVDEADTLLTESADFTDVVFSQSCCRILSTTGVVPDGESVTHVLSMISEIQMLDVDACVDVAGVKDVQITGITVHNAPDSTRSADLTSIEFRRGSVATEVDAVISRRHCRCLNDQTHLTRSASFQFGIRNTSFARHHTDYTRCVTNRNLTTASAPWPASEGHNPW